MIRESEVIATMTAKGLKHVATLTKPLHGEAYPHETPREIARRARIIAVLVEFHYPNAVYVFEQVVGVRCLWRELITGVPYEVAA